MFSHLSVGHSVHGGGACVAGEACKGVCVGDVCGGGMCGSGTCMVGGACMAGGMRGRLCAYVQERRPFKRAVRILLECILVSNDF